MSILATAGPPPRDPIIVTICGSPGTGKTSLAATFPNPFLIQTQGETIPRDIADGDAPESIGVTESVETLFRQLIALAQDDHQYQTVIIDSVTGLESLFVEEVMKSDPKAKSIQTCMGGYGAGRDAVAVLHARVRKAAEFLKKRGMNVVFIAHSDITRIDPPDSEGYTQYSLRLHSKSMAAYVDSVDVVGFIKQETALVGEDKKKRAISGGDRVLVTSLTPTAITKNRLGITEDLPLEQGINPLAAWAVQPATPKKASKAKAVESEAEPETADIDPADFVTGE